MLTNKPNIVIAHPPKRNRPRPKATAVPARSVVDHRKVADVSEDDLRQRGETAGSAVAGDQARGGEGR
jgi:hypothetical protein